MTEEIWRLGACETALAIREGKYSCLEVVQSAAARLSSVNPDLNAVTVDLTKEALDAAKEADLALSNGIKAGPLYGVPITLKENIDLEGKATTLGVSHFLNNVAPGDAPVVRSLKEAGAIIIGQTNMPEFGLRWVTDNPLRGSTNNPWDPERTPGGSSGGAAAAVAMGIGSIAHGNDLGGSLRYPSYCCGLATIKPGFGRVPNFNPSFGASRPISFQLMAVQGPIARSVADVCLAFDVMSRRNILDPLWSPPLKISIPENPTLRIAKPDQLGDEVDISVKQAIDTAAGILSDAGFQVDTVKLPSVEEMLELWGTLLFTDIRVMQKEMIEEHGSEDIVSVINFRLSKYPDATLEDYVKALARRIEVLQQWSIIMEDYPLILAPVSLEPPIGPQEDKESNERYQQILEAQRWLIAANFLGLPAASVPIGISNGLPTGVQLIGRRYHETMCLDVAQVIEDRVGILSHKLWEV